MLRVLKNILFWDEEEIPFYVKWYLYPIGVLVILILIPYVCILLIHHIITDDRKNDWENLSEFGRLGASMTGRGKK